MAPLPKPKGQKVRRGASAPWKELPAEGSGVAAPKLSGLVTDESVREWWQTIWESPMATAWLPADVDGLTRLALLKQQWLVGDAPAVALPAMQQLEDRYGLSPKARRALQWEVARAVADEPKAELAVVKPLKLEKKPS